MSTQKNLGFIIAIIAGIVGLLAFFVLPFVSFLGIISCTGLQVATMSGQGTACHNFGPYAGLQVLWAMPVVAGLILLISLVPVFARQEPGTIRGEAIALIVLAVLAIIGLIVRYIIDSQSVTSGGIAVSLTSFYGAGFWIYAVAMIATLISGILAMRAAVPTLSSSAQPWTPPQYGAPPSSWQQSQSGGQTPPTQYAPPPQYPPSSGEVPPTESSPPPQWQ